MVLTVLKKEDKNRKEGFPIFCYGDTMSDKMKKILKEYLPYVLILVIVIIIKMYVVTPAMVEGSSMDPTLKDGDVMILNRLAYKNKEIKRFDIVVIHDHDTNIIKRVIGLPGERVEFKNNKLYINGKIVKESFNHAETEDFNIKELGSTKVPKDSYFVVGDNRVNSLDSRSIGFIPKKEIKGKTSLTIIPFNRFGTKK